MTNFSLIFGLSVGAILVQTPANLIHCYVLTHSFYYVSHSPGDVERLIYHALDNSDDEKWADIMRGMEWRSFGSRQQSRGRGMGENPLATDFEDSMDIPLKR